MKTSNKTEMGNKLNYVVIAAKTTNTIKALRTELTACTKQTVEIEHVIYSTTCYYNNRKRL